MWWLSAYDKYVTAQYFLFHFAVVFLIYLCEWAIFVLCGAHVYGYSLLQSTGAGPKNFFNFRYREIGKGTYVVSRSPREKQNNLQTVNKSTSPKQVYASLKWETAVGDL